MVSGFDRRVIPESILDFLRNAQAIVPCHLGGGAALSGAYLRHRLTGDIDLFVHGERERHRELVQALPEAADKASCRLEIVRDAGHLVRASLETSEGRTELDLVHKQGPENAGVRPKVEGIEVATIEDLRAKKLARIFSRSDPRDLVDLYFLDRAGFAPADHLEIAVRQDANSDPTIAAGQLSRLPLGPLPPLLEPCTSDDLRRFRNDLAERIQRV